MELRICNRCSKAHPGRTHCPHCREPLSLRELQFLEGQVFGQYRIEKLIGSGGMGAVFRAVHQTLETPAALKVVLPAEAEEAAVKRFLREARLHARLRHPNIVEVYDCGVGAFEIPYYVMEFLEGRTLRDLLGEHPDGLSYAETCVHVRAIGDALHFAHRKGVVHRDLKPENVFVVQFDGRCLDKLLDFGIAKTVAEGHETTRLTGTGAVVGTPGYFAPEQLTNADVGPHTDQYSFGLLVAELLTGRMVRAGKTLGEIVAYETQRPIAPEFLARVRAPEYAKAAVERATQPRPADRFPGVREFVAAFVGDSESFLAATRPSGAAPPPDSSPAPLASSPSLRTAAPVTVAARRARRGGHRLAVAAAALAAVLAAAAAVLLWPGSGDHAGGSAASLPLLERLRALPAPPETLRLAGAGGGVFALAGRGTLYSVTNTDGAVPAPLALPAGAEWVGPSIGGLLVRQGERLFVRNLAQGEDESPVAGLPPGRSMACSASGRHCAVEREGAVEIYGVSGDAFAPLFPVEERPADVRAAAVTDRHVAIVARERLQVFALPSGDRVLEAPFSEPRINALAVQDEAGLVAVGGWFAGVHLFRIGGPPRVLERRGQVHGLAFLPEGPVLAVAGDGGLQLWREEDGWFASVGSPDDVYLDVLFAGDGLAVLHKQRGELLSLAYRGFEARRRARASTREIWALAAEPDTGRIFAGSSDGNLYVLDPHGEALERKSLHGQGVTALAIGGGYLASASDDKTVAVWKLPELSVVWRSRAHDFLVNWLYLEDRSGILWSSSSDGKVKRWRWPELEEVESVDVGRRSVAATWANNDGTLVLAGTWNRALVVARKGSGGWTVERVIPVRSLGLYWMVPLPELELVVFVGIRPGALFAYDLRADDLFEIPSAQVDLTTAVAEPDGRGVLALGVGVVLRYAFERDERGAVLYSVDGHVHTDLGGVLAATNLPGGHGFVLGNERGEIWQVERSALRARPLITRSPLLPRSRAESDPATRDAVAQTGGTL